MTEYEAARLVLAVSGIGLAWTALRDLRTGGEFTGRGVLSWDLVGVGRLRRLPWLGRLMGWPGHRLVLAAQLVAGLAAPVVAASPGAGSAVVACVLLTTVLLTVERTGYGLDGADQMVVLDLIAAAGTLVVGGVIGRLLLAFLSAQLLLSYTISGAAKLVSPVWRDGSCLALILSTDSYGSPRLAATLRARPALALAMAWFVIVLEVTFAGTLVLPAPALWCVLAAAFALHLGIAVTMGLVNFLFAFTAAYPALTYTISAYLH
ncbi:MULTISPECIES: hypothetical protein [Amycolatopsis]|uniref:HTTM-like domain-containing protein n=2 Tax=Amycolatopsis TaxID=1813 RepID=A0A1I3WMX9_9PSEU|nr:hypothetical protein [Amycolatopsis sacchari]SFK08529.1 hypothetical protein SAMN05421835_113131 [Amycolatopsis sacchari]